MKAGWEEVQTEAVLKLNYGKSFPKAERDSKGSIPIYGANGILDWANRQLLEGPTLIIGRKGSAGEITSVDGPLWPSDVTYYTTHDAERIDFRFMEYALRQLDLPSMARGVKPGINRNDVYARKIPLPPLEEQRRIVAVLDQAFEGLARARENTEANLASVRELFETYLHERAEHHANKYGTVSINSISDEVTDGDHMPPPKAETGIPFITISNVDKDTRKIDFLSTFKVPEAYYNALKEKRKPRPGDILYTVTGSFGIPVLVEGNQVFCFQRHIALIRPAEKIDSEWLYYMLMSRSVFNQANAGATGTAQRTVSLKLLRNLRLPQTPFDQQTQLAAKLRYWIETCRNVSIAYESKFQAIEDLRQSLLQKAFAGELTQTSTAEVEAAGVAASDEATTASIIMLAYDAHKSVDRDRTFGRKKAQKVIHLVDHYTDLMPGRQPIKDAAGPNDFPHMLKAEAWAEQHRAFRMKKRPSGGYDFLESEDYRSELRAARKRLTPHAETLQRIFDVLIPMNSQEAEVFATVHAAWNNLIKDGGETDDETIVTEAREKWHADKSGIDRQMFFEAIKQIRACGLLPDGTGKYVGGQGSLL